MPDKETAARSLAALHYQFEPGMREIYRLLADDQAEQDPDEPIKLLEVNKDTIPAGIMPLGFDGVPISGNYPTVIIEITPAEFDDVRCGKREVPVGWRLSSAPLPRPASSEAI